ncbi:MAG: RagB/SusD family nutrient uptake outer membrane protein [Pedobacter sp.]|uniref:RagB/SusD family nutrient uptake outer membrane protein n=1 Tax=Pedobacter sp. TaxID=1411316 RepID=UPI002808E728|nr:RagB/SusD family nutrient uptake outer membrane protein [Pedobacter sp.]MDQ8004764.1 RagB/SusD family nutrient uptake outer membrane protein [Pedobacter sp.]
MNKKRAILLLLAIFSVFSACKKDYLSFDYNDGNITGEDVWASDLHTRGFLNNCYGGMLARYDLGDGSLLAAASDEAVNSNPNGAIVVFNNGTWGPLRTIDDQYANMYNHIRRTNLFLENAATSGIAPISDIPKLMGEAYFLRALYHFELMKRYGGIIIANKSFNPGEDLNLPKNSFEEVVNQIVADCDAAAASLPDVTADLSSENKGRATKSAALALKSRTLLYAASPLNNAANDAAKWQKAADAAKAVIDMNKLVLLTQAQLPNLWNYTALPFNAEVIMATTANNINSVELANAPISYNAGRGRTNPTQELVDAFEMRTTGKPISDPTSGYVATNPYANRDPRLALFIVTNGSTFKSVNVETFVGGKDNNVNNGNTTKTGYYMRKFLTEANFWGTGTQTLSRKPWVLFRYAEILLNYAEALNEAQGAVPEVYTYVNMVRNRVAMPALPLGLTKEQMRERIQNERRVELCFEDHRFYDVRRWNKGVQYFNVPVSGMRITRSGSTLTYLRFEVEPRVFSEKMNRFPFPQAELNRATKLVQNTDW